MSWSNIITACIAGLTLSACGGGGGETSAAPGLSPSAATAFNRKADTVGDFATQKRVQVTKSGNSNAATSTNYYTEFVTEQSGLSHKISTTNSISNSSSTSSTFDQDGKLSKIDLAEGCTYDYLPSYERYLPATVRLDSTWEASFSRNYSCLYSSTKSSEALSVKGKVLGQESIVVAAGTFSTIKYSSTTSRLLPTSSLISELTCWADADSGINVKCDRVQTYTSSTTPQSNYVTTTTDELVAYSHMATQRKKLSAERFAGDWAGTYKGDDHGYCTFNIVPMGQLTGSCQSTGLGGSFALSGAIDASGNLSFILSAGGVSTPTFKGTLDSPGAMNGTWQLSANGGGTWSMQHQ